jgi:hypothetical protein
MAPFNPEISDTLPPAFEQPRCLSNGYIKAVVDSDVPLLGPPRSVSLAGRPQSYMGLGESGAGDYYLFEPRMVVAICAKADRSSH